MKGYVGKDPETYQDKDILKSKTELSDSISNI